MSLCFVCVLGTTLPIPQDPAEPPPPINMNNFTVDNLITGGMAPAMLAASGYANTRPDLYRPSCNQPIVSQPYPTTTAPPQTVFPATGVPGVEDVYRQAWYSTPNDIPQTSPIDYNNQRFPDNRSPSCAQTTPSFRDAYKQYGYDCKY